MQSNNKCSDILSYPPSATAQSHTSPLRVRSGFGSSWPAGSGSQASSPVTALPHLPNPSPLRDSDPFAFTSLTTCQSGASRKCCQTSSTRVWILFASHAMPPAGTGWFVPRGRRAASHGDWSRTPGASRPMGDHAFRSPEGTGNDHHLNRFVFVDW